MVAENLIFPETDHFQFFFPGVDNEQIFGFSRTGIRTEVVIIHTGVHTGIADFIRDISPLAAVSVICSMNLELIGSGCSRYQDTVMAFPDLLYFLLSVFRGLV